VGWAIVVGCTKRQFQTTNLLKVDSKAEFLIIILQVVMFQNVLMDIKIYKKESFFIFFNVFWNLCVFPISYKCKYVLFHLNMLKLFQKINIFFSFEIKLVSNKNFSLKYLIQGFNPHLLMSIHPNCFQSFNELKIKVVNQISPWMIIGRFFCTI